MLYGTQTKLAIENFPISGQRLPAELIHALGQVKWCAAQVNRDLGRFTQPGPLCLTNQQVEALSTACREVWEGQRDDQFPVDVYQTGSGTSSNMNANEVIANRANQIVAEQGLQVTRTIHANDHVNLGQSSNDIFPTAIHVAVAGEIHRKLIPSLRNCQQVLAEKAALWHDVFKIGRTHLADAMPMTLGQEIGGFARQVELAAERAQRLSLQYVNFPSEERPSGPVSTRIASLVVAWPGCSLTTPAFRSSKRPTTSRETLHVMGWSSATDS